MRILTLTVVLFLTNQLFAQFTPRATICDTVYTGQFRPAPCSIAGNGIEGDIYLIQIGTYSHAINPMPNTMMIEYEGLRRYYLMMFFYSYQSAKEYLEFYVDKNVYCDAFVTIFPISGLKIYR